MRSIYSFLLIFTLIFSQITYGMVKCPFCAFDNEDGSLFCEQCKSDLGSVMPSPSPLSAPAPTLTPVHTSSTPSAIPSPSPSPSPLVEGSSSTRKVAMVIVNGGYNSCSASVPTSGEIAENNYLTTVGSKALEYVIQPLKDKDYEVYWVISCFWGSSSYTLQLKTSTNPTHAEIIPWTGTGQTMFYTYLTNFAQTYMNGVMNEMRVVLIGHSNGGYNVLKTAEGLSDSVTFSTLKSNLDADKFMTQIHTLDPISVACSPSSISWNVTFTLGDMPPECLRAPTSTEVNYTKIRDNFSILDNYYQTNYTSLHSGPITQATSNTNVDLPGTQTSSNNAHTRITGHDSTWSSIGNQAVP